MTPVSLKPQEHAPLDTKRVLERVRRLVEGLDLSLVATVGVNLLLDAVLLDPERPTVEAKEQLIDELAASLKTALRISLEGDGQVQ